MSGLRECDVVYAHTIVYLQAIFSLQLALSCKMVHTLYNITAKYNVKPNLSNANIMMYTHWFSERCG